MCEERVVCLQIILHSLVRRDPRIIVQRTKEMFPGTRESMVNVLCLCAQRKVLLSSSANSHGQRN
jgi:hypothetical protein